MSAAVIGHDAAASLLNVAPDVLTKLVGSGVVRRAGHGQYSPAHIIRDYIAYLQGEPDRRERAPTQQEIAAHLDMSDRNLRDVLERLDLDHKEAPLSKIRVGYIRQLREQAAGRASDGPLDLAQERAALAREQRMGIEIKNAVLRGEYAAVTLLAEVLATASQAVAQRFDHLPGQLRKTCAELPPEAIDVVMTAIADARNEWVRGTATLVAASILSADDDTEPDLTGLDDEPRAD
jgi:phage terminase Nu1 subunit (DNA packaging protein)